MHALGGKQILDAERNALKRAGLALAQTLIRRRRHGARLVVGDSDIGIECRVGGIDGAKIGVGQFERGEFPRTKPVARSRNGQFGEFSHLGSVRPASSIMARARQRYSTTLGTRKKFSSLAGALAMISSALPPSVTVSVRWRIVIGVTEVIG